MKKSSIMFLAGAVLCSLPSCGAKTPESVFNDVISNSYTPLGEKYENFRWRNALRFKEEKSDGTKVYTVDDGYTYWDPTGTLFYFRNGINVGFHTSNPEFEFTILGYHIGTPYFGYPDKKDCLWEALQNRGYNNRIGSDTDNHPVIRADDSSYSYVWYCASYEKDERYQINVAVDFYRMIEAPNLGSGIFEIIIDPNGVFPV